MSYFWNTLIGAAVGGLFVLPAPSVAEKFRRQREDAVKVRILRAEARVVIRICEEAARRTLAGKAIWLGMQISGLPARWELAVALQEEAVFQHLIDFQTALRSATFAAKTLEDSTGLIRRLRLKLEKDSPLLGEADANIESIGKTLEKTIDELKIKADRLVTDLDRLIASESPTADS